MIPKNKRRTINVDGVEYEYCVTGCVTVFIKNMLSKESWDFHEEWKEKWKSPITPGFVRELILAHNAGREPDGQKLMDSQWTSISQRLNAESKYA